MGEGNPNGDFTDVDSGGLLYPFWRATISPIHIMVQVPHAIGWWKQWADDVLTEVVERIGPPQIELLPNAQELERVANLCRQLDSPQRSDPWDLLDRLWHLIDDGTLEPGTEANRKLFLLLHRLMRS